MKRKRSRRRTQEFDARVALEALKGIKPVHKIATENDIHPVKGLQGKMESQTRLTQMQESGRKP